MDNSAYIKPPDTYRWYHHQYVLLGIIWFVVTLINIDKAFHIDDVFHHEAALWIVDHPLTPMSGNINWYNDPEPISHANQPPLYFYLIALWGKIFSFSEIMLHLMQSIFSWLCIYLFFKITNHY